MSSPITDEELRKIVAFIHSLSVKLVSTNPCADGVTTTELGLPARGTNLNEWIDSQFATFQSGDRLISIELAADIARGAALQVIADKETLILNLERSGYTVTRNDTVGYSFNMLAHLYRQRSWSEKTFGPGERTAGVVDHIRSELIEIESNPTDLSEWIDVVILALDGAWRVGYGPHEIIAALVAKTNKNEQRVWPDWRTADPGKKIEHDRNHD